MTTDQPFNIACACKLGRILGGHDPVSTVRDMNPLPARSEPVTMEEIRYVAALDALAKEGTRKKAAARLQISKGQFFDIILRRQGRKVTINSSKLIQLAKVAAALLLYALCVSVATAQPTLPFPAKTATLANQIGSAPVLSTNTTQAITTVPAPPVRPLGSVELAWNPSPDSSVTGYRIYQGGITGNYTNSYAVGNRTNATVAPLLEGVTYYFAVTAYDATGVESPFSNEVQFTAKVRGTIEIAAWRYKNPGIFGQTNEIVESTNDMKTWQVLKTFVGDGTVQTVVATNYTKAMYKVRIKGQP